MTWLKSASKSLECEANRFVPYEHFQTTRKQRYSIKTGKRYQCVFLIYCKQNYVWCAKRLRFSWRWCKQQDFYSILERAASWQNQQNGMCTQRRLRPAWASAQPSLRIQWVAKNPSFLQTEKEDSDQTGRMLIWVVAGRTCHFVSFVMRRLKYGKYTETL